MSHVVPRFDFRVECNAAEDLGRSRERLEDAHAVRPDGAVFAVADGMGAHPAGDVAAKLALEAAVELLTDARSQHVLDGFVQNPDLFRRRRVLARLREAVEAANRTLRQHGIAHPECAGMGTTLDVVVLVRNHAFVAHAGDGRVYLARSRATLQLTQDHGKLERLKADNVVRPSSKGDRSMLINAVGLKETVMVDTLFVNLHKGDRLLVCTDGVHDQVGSEADLSRLMRTGSVKDAVKGLIRAAARRGRDNATAVLIEVGERFVRRAGAEHGFSEREFELVKQCALLSGLPDSAAFATLVAAVEVELAEGRGVPRVVANDLVAYVVIEGVIAVDETSKVGAGAVLFPESLVGVWDSVPLPQVETRARLFRMRADDFREVCQDPALGAQVYERLASLLARTLVARRGGAGHSERPDAHGGGASGPISEPSPATNPDE